MTMSEDLKRAGQSQEEAYFHKINKELIERRRKELDAQKHAQKNQTQGSFWMKCPKCGGEMTEIDLSGIKVDQCGGCQGIYFDSGELQILLELKEPRGFFEKIKRLF